ncbi:phosphoribosylformylglycinamidine synthase subunit PurQ [Prosthecomicrobium pneumaticum]|uniref:Phosphoribosylformylglycinamidine synthase subunit PurQ n=1 Tax=Prosthecomicrobium pneumaticum TaxID=81895 RepID=A0A7W9L3G4_9HYPH|nr:phosphoribosylformylglycinamidine synthase subunit PurQ [Prosthecomicrobium pneumaticum]MBB5754538.1 phosphoribosylformylglycinamidine synthase [Prosthecomicrobium pneumaticum]
MKAAVVVFPGSNRERDMIAALEQISGRRPDVVWHADTELPKVDLIVVPGGFSYGDYLRSGAIAARAPIMRTIAERAAAGVAVLGVCNGFQILCEAGLLPGVLMRNAGLRFVCKEVHLRVETTASPFTADYEAGDVIRCPVAHGDGNYRCDDETFRRLTGDERIAFRYVDATGARTPAANPNGSLDDIAGILSEARNVLGMMPHPENLIEPLHGGTDCRPLFESLVERLGVAA